MPPPRRRGIISDIIDRCEIYSEIYPFADDAKLFHHILQASDHCSQQSGTSCSRAAATVCPRPSPPPWAPKRLPPPSRRQRSSRFPRPTRSHAHRYSHLTRQQGDEQSGLATLTFDLLTLKVVSESRVTWATSVLMLVFLGLCSRVRPDVRDSQTDVRQKHRLMSPPIRAGGIINELRDWTQNW